jgi:thiol-disulfide isomerase/thioredoxin
MTADGPWPKRPPQISLAALGRAAATGVAGDGAVGGERASSRAGAAGATGLGRGGAAGALALDPVFAGFLRGGGLACLFFLPGGVLRFLVVIARPETGGAVHVPSHRVSAALAGLGALVILAISGPVARGDGGKCVPKQGEIANFQAARPPLTAPAEPFFDADDRPRTFADYRGKGLVVNFWATWCAPCVKEMPHLDRLNALLRNEGVEVLTLSADRAGARVVRPFYEKHGLKTLPILIDKETKVTRALGIKGLPTTVLIDRDGREVGRVVGLAEWDSPTMVAFLRRCLGPAPPLKTTELDSPPREKPRP